MNRTQYQRILQPAIDDAISLLIDNEKKHCEGIQYSPEDALKAARHLLSSELGEHNPDGFTHGKAALVRCLKVVLKGLNYD